MLVAGRSWASCLSRLKEKAKSEIATGGGPPLDIRPRARCRRMPRRDIFDLLLSLHETALSKSYSTFPATSKPRHRACLAPTLASRPAPSPIVSTDSADCLSAPRSTALMRNDPDLRLLGRNTDQSRERGRQIRMQTRLRFVEHHEPQRPGCQKRRAPQKVAERKVYPAARVLRYQSGLLTRSRQF
jgi:hypothetical protein